MANRDHRCQIANILDSDAGIATDFHWPGKIDAAAANWLAPIIAPRRPPGATNEAALPRMFSNFSTALKVIRAAFS